MDTIFAGDSRFSQRGSGLEQSELLRELQEMTGVPAVEWMDRSRESESESGRQARLERLADALLKLDPAKARRAAMLHRRVLGEPVVVDVNDPAIAEDASTTPARPLAGVAA